MWYNVYKSQVKRPIICHSPDKAEDLWQWTKEELQDQIKRGKAFGNLYVKGIETARTVGDACALQLEKAYADWRERVGLR